MIARTLLETATLNVTAYCCDAGPGTRPYPEAHGAFSIAYVLSGSFAYACCGARWDLVPGSVLMGRPGDEFVCSHEHVRGDRCLSFSFTPELADSISPNLWGSGGLPPLQQTAVLGELARAAASGRADVALEEAGLMLAARAIDLAGGAPAPMRDVSPVDRRRAVEAACWIEAHAQAPVDLAQAADQAGLSRFHFLRVFTRVIGVTPHQHLIRARVRNAARMLAGSDLPVTEVAFKAGFGDLSNFVRTFGRAAGVSPAAFRRRVHGDRNFRQVWGGARG
jgi:AraC-like DNA-binding protein